MNNLDRLDTILIELRKGNLTVINNDNTRFINEVAVDQLNKADHSQSDLLEVEMVLHISNILYNNTDKNLLPLEDGIFDLVLELYKNHNSNWQVGAEPIHFENSEIQYASQKIVNPVQFVDRDKVFEMLFGHNIIDNMKLQKEDILFNPVAFDIVDYSLSKRVVNMKHNYPKLVGTLDKVKFVLNAQAQEKGVFYDSNVKILERDFFGGHLQSGLLDMNRVFSIVAELKYDGMSIEADVSDEILSARTRGDAVNDVSADVTPILQGYKFPRAAGIVPKDNIFGMKFEAIMTYDNICKYNRARGKSYKNARTAISSIFASSDGYKYRDYITLVPLATSLEIDRLSEIEFLNKYYFTGVDLRYAVITGDYVNVMFQIKKFVEEAEYLRDYMPFLYDGVVLSYIEPDLIDALGRVNAVNKYSIAVKFNPLKKLTVFREYKFTVGQDGSVTPIIYFDPIEFYGGVHDHSTAHSYERFRALGLRVGDIIEAEYVNDVMPYVTKPENSNNDNNPNPLFPFIEVCPSCGNVLKPSKSGKSMLCDNIECPERNVRRIASLVEKLNIKDFAEDSFIKIGKKTLTELLNTKLEEVLFLGDITSQKFIDRMNEIKSKPIEDYRMIGALGFTSIAIEKWKPILNKFTLQELLSMDYNMMKEILVNIKGVGPVTARTISDEFEFFKDDLITVSNMSNIIITKGLKKQGKSIRFTGFRDKALLEQLKAMGHDADDKAGVTKNTDILLVPEAGHKSSKIDKIGENTLIVPVKDFIADMYRYLE